MEQPSAGNKEMFDGAMQSDIVVFQRPDQKEKTEAIKLLKQVGKKIVFDNDDTYRPDSGYVKLNEAYNKKMVSEVNEELYKNIKQADLVTTTTKTLYDEYRQLNDNVVILPNCVDPFDWDEPQRNDTSKVRIGLVGSVGYDDYKIIQDYLLELAGRDDVQLVMFSLTDPKITKDKIQDIYKESYEFVKNLSIEWHQHVPMAQYFDKLNELKLDMMLIPRKPTYFNKAKSNIKFLEASMLEIPVVASSFKDGPYEEIYHDIGRLAVTEDDWRKKTEELIANKKLRRGIGKNAKKYTLDNYNIENKYHLWRDAYKTLIQ
jgi:glycosyltransferase involved in cell wall biosynthesis